MPLLKKKHREELAEWGYTVVPGILSEDDCQLYIQQYVDWIEHSFDQGAFPYTRHSLISGHITWAGTSHGQAHHMGSHITWIGTSHGQAHHMGRHITWTGTSHGQAHHMDRHITWTGTSHITWAGK
ncbi:hypothetical protein ACOMHN_007259 [Nucella lapillus]